MTAKSMDTFFADKPETRQIFEAVAAQVHAAGPSDMTVAVQISFGVNRKFAWFWLYNVTQKNPNGVLHLMLALDTKVDDPHVRNITQISKNRWNHQVVIRTVADAKSVWLGKLITQAYDYASKE